MVRRSQGFTIVEVMIALAVTSTLLLIAASVLKGQTTETAFQQSLRDVQSKIDDVTYSVGNGLYATTQNYDCQLIDVNGVKRPTLVASAKQFVGSDQDCIFLGRAIQVVKNISTLYIYTVFGAREYLAADGSTVTASNYTQANPTPAISSGADLTETYYPTTGGLNLLSAHYDGSTTTETDMAGFYNDPLGASGSGERLLTKAYSITSNASTPRTNVLECIEEVGCTAFPMQHWLLCYQSNDKNQTALMDVAFSNTGISTRVNFQSCT